MKKWIAVRSKDSRRIITCLVLVGFLAMGMFILNLNSSAIAISMLQSRGYECTEYYAEVVDKHIETRSSGFPVSVVNPEHYLTISIDGFSGEAPIIVSSSTFDEVHVGDVVVCRGYAGPKGDLKRLEYIGVCPILEE